MKTLVTGGTGFVGRKLLAYLEDVDVVSRNAAAAAKRIPEKAGVIEWNPAATLHDFSTDQNYSAVVNLMGESIAEGRWSEEKKRRIRNSRVIGTRNLVDSLVNSKKLPDVLVSASAVGFYGDPGQMEVTEAHPVGSGFLPEVCEQWEAEANRLQEYGVRVVTVRVGIVLGREGGALEKLLPIFRLGLGGKLGNGKQWMPWIHVDDLVHLIVWAVQSPDLSGPVNAVAPNPVRNAQFTRSLAAAVRRPAILPAPKFGLKLVLGEFADSLFFSQRVVPKKAISNGFEFQFPDLESALKHIVIH